jgi:hypothetical protein
MHPILLHTVYTGNSLEPEEINGTCRKKIHTEIMAGGFTVNLYSQFTVITLAERTAYTLKIYVPYNSHNVMQIVSVCTITVKKKLHHLTIRWRQTSNPNITKLTTQSIVLFDELIIICLVKKLLACYGT